MISGKKLAQVVRTSRKLFIEKTEDFYQVTDTYILVKLNTEEFQEFFSKYNSYKTTANIPFELPNHQVFSSKRNEDFTEDQLNFNVVLEQAESAEEVELTEFYKNDARLYKLGDKLSMFNKKYEFLLDKGDTLKAQAKKKPLFILADDEVKAAIMPIRTTKDEPDLEAQIAHLIDYQKSLKEAS